MSRKIVRIETLEALRQLARGEQVTALQSHENGNEPLGAHAYLSIPAPMKAAT